MSAGIFPDGYSGDSGIDFVQRYHVAGLYCRFYNGFNAEPEQSTCGGDQYAGCIYSAPVSYTHLDVYKRQSVGGTDEKEDAKDYKK